MNVTRCIDQNLGPTLGCANVSQSEVDRAVCELAVRCSQIYASLKQKTGLQFTFWSDGFMSIPEKHIQELSSGQARYFTQMRKDVKKLNENDPLGEILVRLNKRLIELGFPCDAVEIRFEKGCFNSLVPQWHLDGPEMSRSITICFSTKPSWSTRVLDVELFTQLNIPSTSAIQQNPATLQKIETLAKPAKFGYFYDARTVLHRSPKETDLQNDTISPDDYRLFFRFTSTFNGGPHPSLVSRL